MYGKEVEIVRFCLGRVGVEDGVIAFSSELKHSRSV